MPAPLRLTTERLNDRGYRLVSKGGDVTDYLNNPVLLYDHIRTGYENHDDIILPIGKLNNVRLENDVWIGDPEFDQDDDFAKKVNRKYDKGYLNAASVGIEIIELSTDPDLMVPGQTMPTVTKWILKEVSITDIPSNADCVKLSYRDKILTLNGKTNPSEVKEFFSSIKPNSTMKKVIAVLTASKLVTVPENATEELVAESAQVLVNQLSTKDQTILSKDAEITRLTNELANQKTAGLKDKATTLVEAALSAKKIVAAQKENLIKLASTSEEGYTGVKSMLDSLHAYENVKDRIESPDGETDADRVALYKKLHTENGLAALKAKSPERFNQLLESFKASKKA